MRVEGDPVRKEHLDADDGCRRWTLFSGCRDGTVAKAVQSNNADGMYILLVEESVEWSGFVKETTTKVRGRALKLEDFGSVDQDRATRVRVEKRQSIEIEGEQDDGNRIDRAVATGMYLRRL